MVEGHERSEFEDADSTSWCDENYCYSADIEECMSALRVEVADINVGTLLIGLFVP